MCEASAVTRAPSSASKPEPRSQGLLLPGLALLALVVLVAQVWPRTSPWVGKEAPDFSVPLIANAEPGSRARLSELRGHVVILDFWATWCGPCRLQAPIVERVSKRWAERGVVVLGVDVDEEPGVAAAFAREEGLSYPLASDERRQASAALDVERLPTLVVIDPQGRVRAYRTGLVSEGTLDELVRESL